ncbi:DNA primase [Buchnera aphidicola]|uniref:DNA primase n=1 Tax=Buchnera aphidicola (Anoecia oenotherae) TaxID=1241833 RepID=A0A4D6XXF8_9GAMM|nr:DNA primase [Buchnera aphidicola]QCI19184.1 DNA primase [Buchnera aphidicola (Anoecia oenotherae)]
MKRKISKEFINSLLQKTNIVSIIENRIKLIKRGKNYSARCPFHIEKYPSFTVSYEKQFYYCFGCHVHGNVIDFLISYDRKTFIEAIFELASINNIDVPELKIKFSRKISSFKYVKYYRIMNFITKIYQKNIFLSCNKKFLNYLIDRGIKKKIINLFTLGCSSNNSYNFFKKMKNNEILLDCGVFFENNQKIFLDRFINRIIFPLRDESGQVIGLGSRNISSAFPKYLNSPETIIFKKRKFLYGLYESICMTSNIPYLIVVEGYIDVITLTQYGIFHSVALLGTSISNDHLQLLFKKTNNIIYCFDGDRAGRTASWRSLICSLSFLSDNRSIKFVFIPKDYDPDSLVRKEGKIKFLKRMKKSISISDFLLYQTLSKKNLNTIDQKIDFIKKVIPLINKIPGKITRFLVKNQLFTILGFSRIKEELIFFKEENYIKNNIFYLDVKQSNIRILIGLLVQNPYLASIIPDIQNLKIAKIQKIIFFLEIIDVCLLYKNINTAQLIELYRGTYKFKVLSKLSHIDFMIEKKKISEVFLDLLVNVYNKALEKQYFKLVLKEKTIGLCWIEKNMLWDISKVLSGN